MINESFHVVARRVAFCILALLTSTVVMAQQPSRLPTVYVADDGTLYHRKDCPSIQGISKIVPYRRDRLPPGSLPCEVCRPDDAAYDPPTEAPIVIGPYSKGIQPLDQEAYAEAITCGNGRNVLSCAGPRFTACDLQTVQVSISTPFGRVVDGIFADRRQLREPRPLAMNVANFNGVLIRVSPGDDFLRMQSVTRMVLEREGRRIEPIASDITQEVMQNGFGATKRVNAGLFRVNYDDLAPGADVTVRVAVEGGSPMSCILRDADLKRIR